MYVFYKSKVVFIFLSQEQYLDGDDAASNDDNQSVSIEGMDVSDFEDVGDGDKMEENGDYEETEENNHDVQQQTPTSDRYESHDYHSTGQRSPGGGQRRRQPGPQPPPPTHPQPLPRSPPNKPPHSQRTAAHRGERSSPHPPSSHTTGITHRPTTPVQQPQNGVVQV